VGGSTLKASIKLGSPTSLPIPGGGRGASTPPKRSPSPPAPQPTPTGSGPPPVTYAEGQFLAGGARSGSWSRLGLAGSPSPGPRSPRLPSQDLGPEERAAGSRGGAHQAELANFVVGHKAEDVLDGYDGQRHQRVVLRQLVRSQRRGWRRLGPRLRGLGRGQRGLSLNRASSRRGAAVTVAAATLLSHPLFRRRRHLRSLIPSPTVRGTGHFRCVTSASCNLRGGGTRARGRSLWGDRQKEMATLLFMPLERRENTVNPKKGSGLGHFLS
jgi:hypothetical protein